MNYLFCRLLVAEMFALRAAGPDAFLLWNLLFFM